MELDKVPDEPKGLSDMGAFLPSQHLPYEGQEFVHDVRGDAIGGRLIVIREDLSEEEHQKALRARRISIILPVGREALESADEDGSRRVVQRELGGANCGHEKLKHEHEAAVAQVL